MTRPPASPFAAYAGAPVVVLGASGFIGRWVARLLSRAGARAHFLVRDAGAARQTLSRFDARGEVIQIDLQEPGRLAGLLAEVRPAVTFNLAGYGVDRSETDARVGEAINARLIPLLCQALAPGADRRWLGQNLVHAGSALEYGDLRGAVHEDSPPHPTTWYGRTKLEGTRLLAAWCAILGLKGVTARLFTVYGPGEHAGRLLPALCDAAATGTRVALTSGLQERDFTYVEDVAEGLLRLGLAPAVPGGCANLATGRLLAVRGFAEMAAPVLGLRRDQLGFGLLPGRPHELQHGPVSVARLRQALGWAPATGVPEGVRRTVEFVRAAPGAEAVA
jgi:nucleoside-diphosphate-sugar epimerase